MDPAALASTFIAASAGQFQLAVADTGGDVEKTVEQLIQLANDRGGMDNVSAAALSISGKIASSDHAKLKTVTVEAEPHEYFENEKQWGLTALDHAKIVTSEPRKKKGRPSMATTRRPASF